MSEIPLLVELTRSSTRRVRAYSKMTVLWKQGQSIEAEYRVVEGVVELASNRHMSPGRLDTTYFPSNHVRAYATQDGGM